MVISTEALEHESINKTTKSINILIVDDDSDDLMLIEDLVEEGIKHINIDEASSFSAALEKLQDNEYDICLFDYVLGKENGLELLEACREEGVITPVIFLTGQRDEIVAVQMMKAGAADYISKAHLTARKLCNSIKDTVRAQSEIERIIDYWNERV